MTTALELAALDDPVELSTFTHVTDARDGRRLAQSSLRVSGLHCAACSHTIEQALLGVDGVLSARVSAASRCASVRWDVARTRVSSLVEAVRRAGYDAVPDTAAAARSQRERERREMTWRVFVAAFCAMQVMMLATPAYVSEPGELAPDLKRLLDWGSWLLSVPVLLFSAAPFFAGAWRSVSSRRIGMDVPVALGIAVAFVASTGAAFDPGGVFGHEVWFDSLTMFISFLLAGRWLEMSARHRAAAALEEATSRLPQRVVRVRTDGTLESVSPLALRPGDVVRVTAGQAFAADGVLMLGSTQADESLLTGEARPVPKRPGDAVVAGSLNRGDPVEMQVKRVGADTRYEGIVALMREALTQRPAIVRSVDRWAAPFLWTVLLLAAAASAAWSVFDPSRALWVAVSVLIVTCPCALSLAAPSALIAAAGASARKGVLLRRLDALETLARVQHLFLDKTGTLTESRLACTDMELLNPRADAGELKRAAASLAAWSQHPLAKAVLEAHGPAQGDWSEMREAPGFGLEGRDPQGRVWRLGSSQWTGVQDAGAGQAWLSCEGRPLAAFVFDERLRGDANDALQALQRDGVRLTLLSGDRKPRVDRVSEALGLDASAGGLSPEGKLDALREAQQHGEVVAMVGDGINDAPVLAQADLSVAMGERAFVTRANPDAVLLSHSRGALVSARQLANRTLRVTRQNMLWAAAYNK
jgi:Cu2+-exporting ATPase